MSLRDLIPRERLPELHNLPTTEPAVNLAREDVDYEIIRVKKTCIPRGARLVEAYICGSVLLVIGQPAPEDEDHNCDMVGCGTLSHVIFRCVLPSPLRGIPTPEARP